MAVLKAVIIGSKQKAEFFQHLLSHFSNFEFSGYYDPDDPSNSDALGQLLFSYELCEKADVFIFDKNIKLADPGLIENFIKLGKHLLFDGFLIREVDTAMRIKSLHQEAGTCIQISNTLHNKPLFTTASQFIRKPRFIKLEKNTLIPKPGEFDAWLFDNLAQELDIILRMTESGVRQISARPLFLFGSSPDLINIHIEFDNDSVCHISAGRAIENGTHKLRVFQQDKLFHLDFNENQLTEYRPANPTDQLSILSDGHEDNSHELSEIHRAVMPFDIWKMELRNFSENIAKHLSPVTGLDHLEQVTSTSDSIVAKVTRKYAGV